MSTGTLYAPRPVPGHDRELGAAGRSVRSRRRRRQLRWNLVVAGLALLVAALFLLSLCIGERTYSIGEVVQVIAGQHVPGASFGVGVLRLPRACGAVLAGAAFGVVGTCFQVLLRNTLASPDIIGVTAGANTAAVAGIILFGLSGLALTGLAVAGGLVTAVAIALLAWQGSGATSRLILVGIAAASMFDAATLWIMTRGSQWDIQAASRWLTGSLNGLSWASLAPLIGALLVGLPLVGLMSRQLGNLQLGDDVASGLGVRVSLTRAAIMLVGVVVLAAATATTGPIAFVSLLCGPIALNLVGAGHSTLLPAALVGSAMVLASDFIAAHLLLRSYPVGVVTGILGGLYLIVPLIRMGRRTRGAA